MDEKTPAFRQRRAADTARWRERLHRGAAVYPGSSAGRSLPSRPAGPCQRGAVALRGPEGRDAVRSDALPQELRSLLLRATIAPPITTCNRARQEDDFLAGTEEDASFAPSVRRAFVHSTAWGFSECELRRARFRIHS